MLDHEFYNGFTHESNAFLSNFYESPIVCDDGTFPSGEAMFQAQKTLDQRERELIIAAPTPGEAKRRGRQVELRADWDERIRYDAMRRVVAAKFSDIDLGERLIATGNACWWSVTGGMTRPGDAATALGIRPRRAATCSAAT